MDRSAPATGQDAQERLDAQMTAHVLVQSLRPRQWTKNLLVFAPLVAAGLQLDWSAWMRASAAFVGFCCAASAVYLINDVADAARDRNHPTKRNRAVASGLLPRSTALVIALSLALVAVLITWSLAAAAALTVIAYVILHVSYSLWLKAVPIVEMLAVAAGFVLRGVAGGFALGVVVSQWFLLVTAVGALFVIAGKRYSELANHPGAGTRPSLANYDPEFLKGLLSMSATSTVLGYVLWSFGIDREGSSALAQLTAVPFTLTILLYWADSLRARAEAPDVLLTSDRWLLAAITTWALMFSAATLLTPAPSVA